MDERDKKLSERELALDKPVSEQNERFEKLRKGYVSLRLINDDTETEFQPSTRDTFELMLKILKNKYNIDTIQLEKLDDRNKMEQYFAELIPLIQNRWSSICGYKRLWKERRVEIKNNILSLINADLNELLTCKNSFEPTKWLEKANLLFSSLDKLIKEEEDLITLSESLQTELEDLFKQRDEIFIKADRLFGM